MSGPFSRIYCAPDSPLNDSARLRRRLGSYAAKFDLKYLHHIVNKIELETGARVPFVGVKKSLDSFFQGAELRDVLDAITHVHDGIHEAGRPIAGAFYQEQKLAMDVAVGWLLFVRRVLAEEHTAYKIDDRCQVSYAIDEQYALNRRATLAGLRAERWTAVRAEFERSFAALDREPQDTNGAIRAMAAALESCGKVLSGAGISRFGQPEIQRHIRPLCEIAYSGDKVALDASAGILRSMAAWIDASHQYRHGQDSEDEVRAPLDLTVEFLTAGSGFIRWLIGLDRSQGLQSGS